MVVQYTHANSSVSYQWLGTVAANSNWTQTSYAFTTPSTAVKVSVLHVLNAVGYLNVDDASLSLTTQATGTPTVLANDTVTRTQSGRITTDVVQSGANQLWHTYGYDAAGRLTNANIGPHTYSYGFGAQNASTCGTGAGTNTNSGKNSNRTSRTVDGVTNYYCYDNADRLTASSDPNHNYAEYDSRGNMTYLGTGASPQRFCYDSSDRNWCMVSYGSANGNGTAIYYDRDALGRITYREKDTIAAWNWTLANQWFNFYTGPDGGVDYVRDINWNITEKYLSLPGGVSLTIKPQESQANNKKQYNLPNVHGDIMLTTNAVGANTSTGNGPASSYVYDPFGNQVTGSGYPNNTAVAGSYAWAGAHKKLTETSFTLTPMVMGARVYLPSIARFTQADPVEGGTPNNYVYVTDPINANDYSGMFCLQACGNVAAFLQPAAPSKPLQPATPSKPLQPATPSRPLQPAAQGAQVQGPGSVRGQVKLAPTTPAPPPSPSVVNPIFIEKVVWKEGILQVYPTNLGRYIPSSVAGELAWREVKLLAPGANKPGMDDQFFCHWDFVRIRAPRKESWNLDSDRPDVSYWSTVMNYCNPPQ